MADLLAVGSQDAAHEVCPGTMRLKLPGDGFGILDQAASAGKQAVVKSPAPDPAVADDSAPDIFVVEIGDGLTDPADRRKGKGQAGKEGGIGKELDGSRLIRIHLEILHGR